MQMGLITIINEGPFNNNLLLTMLKYPIAL